MQSSEMRKASTASSYAAIATSSESSNGEGGFASPRARHPKKPTRPLTAYHLFFQLEREYILQTTHDRDSDGGGRAAGGDDDEKNVDDRPIGKQVDPSMPYRYRYIRLNPRWHASGSGKRVDDGGDGRAKKRKHRRTHGKIGFLDLSKRIASRWAVLEEEDGATKRYVQDVAARELDGYRIEMGKYKAELLSLSLKPAQIASREAAVFCEPTAAVTTEQKAPSSKQEKNLCMPMESMPSNAPDSILSVEATVAPPSKQVRFMPSATSATSIVTAVEGKRHRPPTGRGSRTATEEASPPPQAKSPAVDSSIVADGNKSPSFPEFSFHPVPSSLWKRYRDRRSAGERRGRRLRSNVDVDAGGSSQRGGVSVATTMSSRSFEGSSGGHRRALYGCPRSRSAPGSRDHVGRGMTGDATKHGRARAPALCSPLDDGTVQTSDVRGGGGGRPGGVDFGRDAARNRGGRSRPPDFEDEIVDAFSSRAYRPDGGRGGRRGRGFGFGTTAPCIVDRRAKRVNDFDEFRYHSAMTCLSPPPPLGLGDDATAGGAITSDDAVGLMEALSGADE